MTTPSVSTFGASASMLGYLYQVRIALLWAIRQSRVGDFAVSIETLDDVSFETGGDPVAVLQTKHSLNAAAVLSDLSPELWKTLRIWMVGLASGEVPASASRFLISTADAPPGTACAALDIDAVTRDVAEAAKRLKHAATTSSNAELQSAFESYLDLPCVDETKVTLAKALGARKSFIYLYDYGDDWEHRVKVEKVLPPDMDLPWPLCLDGRHACPPEDVGGVPGYYEFLDTINDPAHDDHQPMLEWCGGHFDPAAFDLDDVNQRLSEIKL